MFFALLTGCDIQNQRISADYNQRDHLRDMCEARTSWLSAKGRFDSSESTDRCVAYWLRKIAEKL